MAGAPGSAMAGIQRTSFLISNFDFPISEFPLRPEYDLTQLLTRSSATDSSRQLLLLPAVTR